MPTVHAPLIYYVRKAGLIKIGTTTRIRQRMVALKIDELLAVEPGSYDLEAQRHTQFAADLDHRGRGQNEWFHPTDRLLAHVAVVASRYALPDLSTRNRPRLDAEESAFLARLPPLVMTVKAGTLERFAKSVRVDAETGCWRRTSSCDENGYTDFWLEGVQWVGHRAAYVMFVGPIPAGLTLDHVKDRGCQFKDCVNPAHLEAVTARENNLRSGNFAGVNSRVTHCPALHEYTPDNIYWVGAEKNRRQCRKCTNAQSLVRIRAKRAAAKAQDPVLAAALALFPEPVISLPHGALERFAAKVAPDQDSECWRWTGHADKKGFGKFWWDEANRRACAVAYLMFVGPIAPGHDAVHVAEQGCLHRDCVNPAHVAILTEEQCKKIIGRKRRTSKTPPSTHCSHGHLLSPENVYVYDSGRRVCRPCALGRASARHARLRAAAA